MDFKLGKQWIEDRKNVTDLIQRLFGSSSQAENYLEYYKKDDLLLLEGQKLEHIYILLDGVVELYKKKPDVNMDFPIMQLQAGSFIGIIAFTTGQPSLTTSKVIEPSAVLKIPNKEVRKLLKVNERFKGYMDELILANLLDRFRNTIILQMKLNSVNNKLRDERNESQ